MKTLICSLLTLSLTLMLLTTSYAQDADFDTLVAADVNADGTIDILDLTFIASHFGEMPTAAQYPNPDVNGDGTVNILDLTLVANHLGKTVRPPVAFVSVNPAIASSLAVNDTITLTFDNSPDDVTVSTGVATTAGKTVTITGPFIPGPFNLTITWAGGSQTLTYTVTPPDTEAPKITGGTVSDGDKDVDPETINNSARIEVEFSEEVSGNIALQTEDVDDVGWLGKIEGNKGTLELVKGKEIGNETTYVIAGKVLDAAGNETDVKVTFTTASKTSGIPLEVTDATFDTIVLESAVPIVVEFKAEWCPFCQRMKPIVAEIASENRNTFAVAKLDIDESRQTTDKYQIRGIPTYIVFQDGEIVGRFAGAMPKNQLLQQILSVINIEEN